MKSKTKYIDGFTLIELLAVIVILAIIALIATPIILNIIDDSKKESRLINVQSYFRAVDQAIVREKINKKFKVTECDIIKDKINCNDNEIKIDIKGNIPEDGKIKFENGKVSGGTIVYFSDYQAEMDANQKITISKLRKLIGTGEIVYFNVAAGEKCEEKDYRIDNSATGYNGMNPEENQTSCLKFYKFLDYGDKNTVNLILDHNTTEILIRDSNANSSSNEGPKELIEQLKLDTDSWKGTETPDNYTFKYSDIKYTYTIKYNTDEYKYKARIITAQEIAEIVGADKAMGWNESTGSIFNERLNLNEFSWLYDNPSTGYWTSSGQYYSDYSGTWNVTSTGELTVCNTNYTHGVRPVISVLRSKLK